MKKLLIMILLGLMFIFGCSGGNGGNGPTPTGDTDPPEVSVTFPGPLSMTTSTVIDIHGTTLDASRIESVEVAGFLTESLDGFANWKLTNLAFVSFGRELNTLEVLAEDEFGNIIVDMFTIKAVNDILNEGIGSGPTFVSPFSVDVGDNGILAVGDGFGGAIYLVRPDIGERSIISDKATGSGTFFVLPGKVLFENSDSLLVTDHDLVIGDPARLYRVDLSTGDRSLVSSSIRGLGPTFSDVGGMAMENSRSVVLTDPALDAVFRIDLISGNRSILSSSSEGGGPLMVNPQGIVVLSDGFVAVSYNDPLGVITLVDPGSGDREIISDSNFPLIGVGPTIESTREMALLPDGNLAVIDESETIFFVHARTGNRRVISSSNELSNVGRGPAFENLTDIAVEPSGTLVATDASIFPQARQALWRIEVERGDRVVFSK